MIKANELEVGKVYEGVKKQTKEIRRFRVICKDRDIVAIDEDKNLFWKSVVAIDEDKNLVYFDDSSTNSDSDFFFVVNEKRQLLQGFELIPENQYKVLSWRLFENSKYGLTKEDLEGRGDIFDVSVSKDKFGEWNTKVQVVKRGEIV